MLIDHIAEESLILVHDGFGHFLGVKWSQKKNEEDEEFLMQSSALQDFKRYLSII